MEQALHCAKCGEKATFVEEHCGIDFAEGEIVLITCPLTHCKERPSFYCRSCRAKCYLNGLSRHAKSNRHKEQHALKYPTVPIAVSAPQEAATRQIPAFPGDEVLLAANNNPPEEDNIPMDLAAFDQAAIEQDLATTHMENGDCPMDVCPPKPTSNKKGISACPFPPIDRHGHEWLDEALKDTPRATVQDLFGAFGCPKTQHMKNFWVAELGSGDGRCGGGLVLLTGRAFQQVKDSQLEHTRLPDYEEAKWQLNNLIQYQSMNEKQRRRQSGLHNSLMEFFPTEMFFKHTYLPEYNYLGRFYGNTGIHSMWNNLPCPVAEDVDGVAYVSPRAIVTFLMATAIPIDDIVITPDTPLHDTPDHLRRVHNVQESKKAVDWFRQIQSGYYGSKNGAPDSNFSNFGAPKKYPAVVCLHLSDWTDGFDSAKVKSNRNAIDSKTFTVSPPKCLINGTENTFAVALGLKKAKGWRKVEGMFRQEVEELTSASEPVLFYHGALQKMVPCFFKQFAVLSDKAERNGLTGTLGCGSDVHRCFGLSGKVQTPSCKVEKLEQFLSKEMQGQAKAKVGWSHEFINPGNANGAKLPSCPACRKSAVEVLMTGCNAAATTNPSCRQCCNWDLLSPEGASLVFPAHKDYPKIISAGSPVPPPKGRDTFQEGHSLPFMPISWHSMKQACKFAYYQASRPRNPWTKATTVCYLKHCGISTALADELYAAAKKCWKEKGQELVDYARLDGIGKFEFHPAWKSEEVALTDFIEAIMHQLFLGAAESNFELIGLWLSNTPNASKLGHSPFLQSVQVLLKDLRVFNLSWLLAYPLTGKKGKLGTGSWVAENWVCFVRISQFVFGWCIREPEMAKYGVADMSRMVIAFHAFVARCLSHSGIDERAIAEAELFLKEFLSALREFDIRVCYSKLNKETNKASERKGTEAWWLKPNYMSLSNLLKMMRSIGPLVLWWDGGGKGERFIQVVKPHIKKGVREDALSFFSNLLEKLFRVRLLDLFEKRFGLYDESAKDELEAASEILLEIAESIMANEDDNTADGMGDETSADLDEDTLTGSEEEEEEEAEDEIAGNVFDETYFSTNEEYGMTKSKTIYVYRNENQLNDAIVAKKPLAGIVEVKVLGDGKTAFEFYALHRKPVKQFSRRRVVFDDAQGSLFHGLWCAQIKVEDEAVPSTLNFKDIQSAAKLSAVAIPLWYLIGKGKPDSNKYCVLTNWWKYRMSDGTYRLPSLDPELYHSVVEPKNLQEASRTKPKVTVSVEVRNGHEFGEL